jgi:hypothetical protein
MQSALRVVIAISVVMLGGCIPQPQAPSSRTIFASGVSCEKANSYSYQAVEALGYMITSMQTASLSQPGYIVANNEGKDARVTITCTESGATVVPEKTDFNPPSLIGPSERPGEFPAMFDRGFTIIRQRDEYVVAKGPGQGLAITMTRLNSLDAQIQLGSDLIASGILPVKVMISNNTPRTYGVDVNKIVVHASGGGRVAPMAAPAAGQGRTLQGSLTLQPGQMVEGYLFYPAGNYTSASTVVVDKDNDEREGFSVQF